MYNRQTTVTITTTDNRQITYDGATVKVSAQIKDGWRNDAKRDRNVIKQL